MCPYIHHYTYHSIHLLYNTNCIYHHTTILYHYTISLGLCPKGDDQLTPSTGYRTITITLHTEQKWTKISGNFLFQFNGESFLFPGGATAFNAIACKNAFENLHNIAEVDCSLSGIDDYRVTYTVKLKKFPVIPYETNIFTHNGNPSLSSFSCNTDLINKVNPTDHLTCSINEINTEKIYPGKWVLFFYGFYCCFVCIFLFIPMIIWCLVWVIFYILSFY